MALEQNSFGDRPVVAPTAYVHPTATVIGKVTIEGRVFVGPQAVLRADEPGPDRKVSPIIIREGANVQDGAIIHALGGTGVTIGPRSSIAHGAIVHGPCEIGEDCFIGFGSVVFNATLGDGVVVLHKSLVEYATVDATLHVPLMTMVHGDEAASRLTPVTDEMVAFAKKVAQTNIMLAKAALGRK